MNDLLDRFDVRADVVVREHHPFGHAGGAGGEDDGGHVVAAHPIQPEHAIEISAGHQVRHIAPYSLSPRSAFSRRSSR